MTIFRMIVAAGLALIAGVLVEGVKADAPAHVTPSLIGSR